MEYGFFVEELTTSYPKTMIRRCFRTTHLKVVGHGSQEAETKHTPVMVELQEFSAADGQIFNFGVAPDVDDRFERQFGHSLSKICLEWQAQAGLKNELTVARCGLSQAEKEIERKHQKLIAFRKMPFWQRVKFVFGIEP